MKRRAYIGFLGLALAFVLSFGSALAGEQTGDSLEGPEGKIIGTVTGFHSLKLKKSDFEVRLLEAAGSASVAQDPISLYLVVTNNGTSDLQERVWRLRRGVARVRALTPSACGIDIKVDFDRITTDGQVVGRVPKVLHLCFLSPDGKLQAELKESETSR